jgi:hypothetical protein
MMKPQRRFSDSVRFSLRTTLFGIFLLLALAGCKTGPHTSNPHLRQIDEMLNAQLPQGTPKSRVLFFLSSQGFPFESTRDAKIVAATVHRVDTDTLQPETARVTFHFDASDKLKSYELESIAGSATQP